MKRLTVENVSFSYGDKPVLTDVSLSVAPGELVSILGHNACGKTEMLPHWAVDKKSPGA